MRHYTRKYSKNRRKSNKYNNYDKNKAFMKALKRSYYREIQRIRFRIMWKYLSPIEKEIYRRFKLIPPRFWY